MLGQFRYKYSLLVVFIVVLFTVIVGPALADCTTTPNGSGFDYYCTNDTPLVNGSTGNDNITNAGHVLAYLWGAGFGTNATQSDVLVNNGDVGENENDDGIWGGPGPDTIINNGTIYGGPWTVWEGVPGAIFGDDTIGVVDDDVIVNNGVVHGNIHGDYSAGGDDTITINGVVNGGVYGEGSESVMFGRYGNDTVTLTNNAVVTTIIDGMLGNDTLRFSFSTADEPTYNALFDLINAADPAGGSLTFNGNTFNWVNFETLDNAMVLTVPPTIAVTLAEIEMLAVAEAGAIDTYTLVLASPPSAPVMVSVTPDTQCQVNGGSAPITLTFNRVGSSLWSSPQTVTIAAVDDGISEGNHSCSVSHAIAAGSASEYLGTNIASVTAAISDNDGAGIIVSAISGQTNEAGGTATFTMVLNSQPGADVTIGLSSSDLTEGTVSPELVTFTPANWNNAQTITVTGVADAIDDGDVTFSVITAPATSTDPDYNGIDPDDVTVVNSSTTVTNTPEPTATNTPTDVPTNTPLPTNTSEPTDIPTATATATLDPSDVVFGDGFESGSFQAWTAAQTGNGDLSVQSSAALVGSQGMRAVINDNGAIGVRDDTPTNEARYRARFYFDPNTISMANGDRHMIFICANFTTVICQVEVGFNGGNYQLRAATVSDSNSWTQTSWFTITDAPHAVEIDWRKSSAANANNGGLTLWIDGQQMANFSSIDNDTLRVELGAIGPIFGVNSGTRGTYYLDAFESRRQGYIGPVIGAPTSTPPPTNTPEPTATMTNTPEPTATDVPTNTPLPTNTPEPTATHTPTETATVGPTATLTNTPEPTATDEPTNTPLPTNTPEPTATNTPTDVPTNTPLPTNTSEPTDIPIATATATVDPSDVVFGDGFESGSFQAWTAAQTGSGDLSVQSSAALVGNQGMRAVINDNGAIGVRDDTPTNEARYRARFYFDPNTISMANGDRHMIFICANFTTVICQVEVGFNGGNYQLRAAAVSDSNSWTQTSWFTITDAPHAVEIDWRKSSAANANNGGLTLWIDGQQMAHFNSIDNDTLRVELGAIGPIFGVNSGTRGTYYLDAFESRRQGYIGPVIGAPTSTPQPTNTPLPTATATNTPEPTATNTPEPTATNTPEPTATNTPTDVPTNTPSPTETEVDAPTATLTFTPLPTNTPEPTATNTPTDEPTSTPQPTNTPEPTATLAPADVIFGDGFESGNFQAWSSAQTGGGDLSVQPGAALVGSQGMRAVINDNGAIGVRDDIPSNETRYRARFYFDPNTITMANGDRHMIFICASMTRILCQVEFGFNGGNYQIRAAVVSDSNSSTQTSWFTITDASHAIEVDWRSASAPNANNGGLTLWIDGQQMANFSNIDNDTLRVELGAIGPIFGVNNGTRGTYYLDAFESRRETYIGLALDSMAQLAIIPPTVDIPTEAPTNIPIAATVEPTATSMPTMTPLPTETATLEPTATFVPSSTPTEMPTLTPVPTNTPEPTATFTPMPTIEVMPTATADGGEGRSAGEAVPLN